MPTCPYAARRRAAGPANSVSRICRRSGKGGRRENPQRTGFADGASRVRSIPAARSRLRHFLHVAPAARSRHARTRPAEPEHRDPHALPRDRACRIARYDAGRGGPLRERGRHCRDGGGRSGRRSFRPLRPDAATARRTLAAKGPRRPRSESIRPMRARSSSGRGVAMPTGWAI